MAGKGVPKAPKWLFFAMHKNFFAAIWCDLVRFGANAAVFCGWGRDGDRSLVSIQMKRLRLGLGLRLGKATPKNMKCPPVAEAGCGRRSTYRGGRRIEYSKMAAKRHKKRRRSCGCALYAFSRLFTWVQVQAMRRTSQYRAIWLRFARARWRPRLQHPAAESRSQAPGNPFREVCKMSKNRP